MAWLVNALLEVIKDLVYGAFVLITKWFTGTLTLSTGEFHDIFNKGEMNLLDLLVDDVIGPLAVAGVIGIMAYQLYRSMFAKKVQGAVDEPLPLILWSVVAFFLIFNVKPLLNLFSDLIAKAWIWMDGVTHEFSTNFSLDALLSDQKFGDDGSSLNFSSGIGLSGLQMLIGIVLAAVLGWRYLKLMVQYVKRYVRYVYYGDTVTYRQEDYTVTSVGAAEKTVDLDAGTYEITGINAYDEQQEPVTVYYPKYFTVDRNAMQKPEIALLVGEQDTAGTELVCKAPQEMDAYRYVADQKMELPYEAVTGQTDVIDQILASSGGTQESDKKAETSEQTRTEESGDAMKNIVPEKQVTRKWLLPAGIGMACAVCLVLVRKRSFRS